MDELWNKVVMEAEPKTRIASASMAEFAFAIVARSWPNPLRSTCIFVALMVSIRRQQSQATKRKSRQEDHLAVAKSVVGAVEVQTAHVFTVACEEEDDRGHGWSGSVLKHS